MWIWPTLALVLGLLVTDSIAQTSPGLVTTSSNPSGPACSSDPTIRCVTEATCDNGVCECPTGTSGDGSFHCYADGNVRAEVRGSENVLTSFADSTGALVWPCRYRFAEFRTVKAAGSKECQFQVFGENAVVNGRIVLRALEVHFRSRNHPDRASRKGIGIRKLGTVENGVFSYTEWGKNKFQREKAVAGKSPPTPSTNENDLTFASGSGSGDGDGSSHGSDDEEDDDGWSDPVQLTFGNDTIGCEIDEDNFVTVAAPSCGVDIRMRASNPLASQEDQSPGLFVDISGDVRKIKYLNPKTYLAENKVNGRIGKFSRNWKVSLDESVLHTSLQYAAEQYSTAAGEECADTALTYRKNCRKTKYKRRALIECGVFLTESLVACLDPPGSGNPDPDQDVPNSLTAFRLCLWNSCDPSSSVCSLLRSKVHERGCLGKLPADLFLKLSSCSSTMK